MARLGIWTSASGQIASLEVGADGALGVLVVITSNGGIETVTTRHLAEGVRVQVTAPRCVIVKLATTTGIAADVNKDVNTGKCLVIFLYTLLFIQAT